MSRGTFISVIFVVGVAVGLVILHDALSTQATANTTYSVKQNPIIIEPELLDEIVGEFSTPEDAPPVPVPLVLPEPSDSSPASPPVDLEAEYGPSVLVEQTPVVTYERTIVRQSCRTYRSTPVRNFIRRLRGR